MKKLLSLLLTLTLLVGMMAVVIADETVYEASAQGFAGPVKVLVSFTDDGKVATLNISEEGFAETPGIGARALDAEELKGFIGAEVPLTGEGVDALAGATFTKSAIVEAVNEAYASATGTTEEAALAFKAGEYEPSAKGYNGMVNLKVTFSETALTGIEVVSSAETAHVGDIAFDIMKADMLEANGSGVDAVAGATFSSRAFREAVNAAAEAAGCTNLKAFQAATVTHEASEAIDGTWDVVIVGAGGAGMMAAAQAAQDGNTVLVIEKNAEMGGNTLVSGGAFQSVMPYLVWDPADPDATTGVNPLDGQTYDKVLSNINCVDTLKTILNWSEEPFDGTLDDDHPFVAGNIAMNAVRGVHPEYLDTLKALKAEISEYLAWAQPKLDAGINETKLTVFSTKNLHIFQTYYGGLRPSADGSEWIYSRYDLVKQVVDGGQDIKPWLVAQGAIFDYARQFTLIGCLWQRENSPIGGVVNGETINETKWGAYFAVPLNTMLTANEKNELMLRTTAKELIVEDGRVVGVKAEKYDGTPVTAKATKGVILATGGYAANIPMVQETNRYWKSEFIADNIGTTNRSSLMGDGITMASAVGAEIEGTGWTQMMPLGWVDNGNLSGGSGDNVIFINAQTGKRYVDESAERDVLSEGGFENGMIRETAEKLGLKYVPGIYVEVSNTAITAGTGGFNNTVADVPGRMIFRTVEETAELIGCDPAVLRETIETYDKYVMGVIDELPVEKLSIAANGTVGDVEKDSEGNYLPDTYKLEYLRVRFMAPSTHHTMGGVKVDLDRRVLSPEGNPIAGLYAAGEVTGGIHAGNRLGGNAVTEIIVSGRTAAQTVDADSK